MAEPRDRLSPENVRSVLEAWCSRHTLDSFPWIVDRAQVEVPVTATLYVAPRGRCLCGHNHHLRQGLCGSCLCNQYQTTIEFLGKLDLLPRLRRDPSIYCVVDNKTSWRIDAAFVKQYLNDSQITGYMWLAAQHCGKPAHEIIGYVNALEVSLVPNSSMKCKTHGVSYNECGLEHVKFQVVGPIERTASQIDRWRDDAIDQALRYRAMLHKFSEPSGDIDLIPMEGTFTGSCRYCEAFEWCVADRPLRQVPKMFTKQPWSPRDHAYGPKAPKADPLVFTVDNSTLKSAFTCSTQVLMRYGWGYTTNEQRGPLHAGTLIHKGLEGFFTTGSPSAALAAFDDAVDTIEDD